MAQGDQILGMTIDHSTTESVADDLACRGCRFDEKAIVKAPTHIRFVTISRPLPTNPQTLPFPTQ